MYNPASPRTGDVTRMVCRSLDVFFRSECAETLGVTISITDVDVSEGAEKERVEEVPCTICLDTCTDHTYRARFVARHVGGNVYDVQGGLIDGPTETFTCCLPDVNEVPVAPSVGRSIGAFLARELQRVTGRYRIGTEDAEAGNEAGEEGASDRANRDEARRAERRSSQRPDPTRRGRDRSVAAEGAR